MKYKKEPIKKTEKKIDKKDYNTEDLVFTKTIVKNGKVITHPTGYFVFPRY